MINKVNKKSCLFFFETHSTVRTVILQIFRIFKKKLISSYSTDFFQISLTLSNEEKKYFFCRSQIKQFIQQKINVLQYIRFF